MSHYLVFKVQLWICFLRQTFVCLWWRWGESNSWPPACKAGALPAELHPRLVYCFGLFPLHYFVKAPWHTLSIVLRRFALYCKGWRCRACHFGLASGFSVYITSLKLMTYIEYCLRALLCTVNRRRHAATSDLLGFLCNLRFALPDG